MGYITLYMGYIIMLVSNILLVYVLAFVTFAHINIGIILVILLQNIVPVETTYPKLFRGKLWLIVSLLTLTSSAYTCNLLLYGNPSYDFHTNKKILELTISFIISSKIFDGPLISND